MNVRSFLFQKTILRSPSLQIRQEANKMTEEEPKKTFDRKCRQESERISRRTFLKDAGLVMSVPAMGSIAAGAPASMSDKADQDALPAHTIGTEARVIELTVNGDKYRFAVDPHWTLRQMLRDEIGFTSVKDWCGGYGACGSCTVIVDGRPVLSCLTLACECNGSRVETAEGIAKTGHPVIEAYVHNNAFQCGYCTPGFVCTAKALLDRNRMPTEADVRDALGGNLCRCGTYQRHPLAVLEAAAKLKEA
jgi:aerobic-type carbon monoxide dehydrogenase small subunit (CoxS/CutS family)